jgi:aspartate kinase
MQIFKFGGASLKTANAIRNMFAIVCNNLKQPLVIIVSAMGKTTNALEDILERKLQGYDYEDEINLLEKYHWDICFELDAKDNGSLKEGIIEIVKSLKNELSTGGKGKSKEEFYDNIVSYGEILSSRIISTFLNQKGLQCKLHDARELVKTDETFTEGKVLWEETIENIAAFANSLKAGQILLSQGFIASTRDGRTTTLGREGSDFTAAIFARALNADSVTFWKDVPGIMNADPKLIADAILIKELPYQEAAEMTYYGAKVIHPKTIRPLANNKIPLSVRGFDHPHQEGTRIKSFESWKQVPVIIYKTGQVLVSCKFTDFTFVNEKSLVLIFDVLHDLDIKVNMMQNSAISFSVCIDHQEEKTRELISRLDELFEVHYNDNLTLMTIKNYSRDSIEKYKPEGNILLEQQSRLNYQVVFK